MDLGEVVGRGLLAIGLLVLLFFVAKTLLSFYCLKYFGISTKEISVRTPEQRIVLIVRRIVEAVNREEWRGQRLLEKALPSDQVTFLQAVLRHSREKAAYRFEGGSIFWSFDMVYLPRYDANEFFRLPTKARQWEKFVKKWNWLCFMVETGGMRILLRQAPSQESPRRSL